MRARTLDLVADARARQTAVGAFNIYTLDQAVAVVDAAEAARSAIILQVHPGGVGRLLRPLLAGVARIAEASTIGVSIQLDHATEIEHARVAIGEGADSIMADGSTLQYRENVALVSRVVQMAHAQGVAVEGELGRLAGSEDGWTVGELESSLTNPGEAARFVASSGVDLLAVCIGNVHGRSRAAVVLDFDRLAAIAQAIHIPSVLHGASGVPAPAIYRAIDLGVGKININTEIRAAYLAAIRHDDGSDLVDALASGRSAVVPTVERIIAGLTRGGSAGPV